MIEPELAEFDFMEPLLGRLQDARDGQPFVTLSYAQSLDGSISVEPFRTFSLSSERSLRFTHFLRSRHDALLVGINTILSDDPQLTVRHLPGTSPRPVVLDTSLRMPCEARLMRDPSRRPIIVTTSKGSMERRQRLTELGAEILISKPNAEGMVDLAETLRLLHELGVRSVMVEGGGRVITHFLRERLVDYCVITIAPKIIGGVKAVSELCLSANQTPLSLLDCRYHAMEGDLIAFGSVDPD